MTEYLVTVSEAAERDLVDIVKYISAQLAAPISAENMVNAIEEALFGLAYMPHKHPPVTDERLLTMGYRKLVVKNYIAFFSIDEAEKTVDVERILYARRDWLCIL